MLTRTVIVLCLTLVCAVTADAEEGTPVQTWQLGTPIVTYWAGPPMTEAMAKQMAEGGFNLVWCTEQELDTAHKFGLRAYLYGGPMSPEALEDPAKRAELEAYVARVKNHPALYAYHLQDEPSAGRFPALAKLVAFLREQDPAHLAYINLFPTYANNEQLGTEGDTVTAYQKHLDLFMAQVKPALLSYDHYHFGINGNDGGQYFLNLAMIRKAALDAGIPFMNIVQACTWSPGMRIPNREEQRFLIYTTLAYGGLGISYYVYGYPGHQGAIATPDGTPTWRYYALRQFNREFLHIATELQPLRSLGAYHVGMIPEGAEALPSHSAFRFEPPVPATKPEGPKLKGLVMGLFGRGERPSHAMVVNLDYTQQVTTTVVGPGPLELFDAATATWSPAPRGERATLRLLPGGGKLLRVRG